MLNAMMVFLIFPLEVAQISASTLRNFIQTGAFKPSTITAEGFQ